MKKLLLATAAFALLAPAAQAEIKLDLGGYFKGYAGYSNQDTAGFRDFDLRRKSEIFFEGETTLDNGLTVGYHGSLFQEGDNNTTATGPNAGAFTDVAESYLYFSGNWGRVNLGRENGAAYLLQVAAPGADANIDGMDIDFSFINLTADVDQDYKQAGPENNTSLTQGQYADKITYLTPKFNGFQAGVSYSPEYDVQNVNDNVLGMDPDGTAGDLENLLEGAVRYDGEFSGVGIHAGAGYTTASDEAAGAGVDDYQEWNAGLKLTWEGWGFGAAYNTDNGSLDADGDTDNWTGGVDYTYGAYTFGASYFNSQNENAGADDDQLERWALGASYTFGPGMKFNGAIGTFDEEVAGVDANDGTFVTLGTDIQF